MTCEINYNNSAHHSLSMHRQMLAYDPFSMTDDPEFIQDMIEAWEENDTLYTIAELIIMESDEHEAWGEGLPVSYSLLYKTIQLSWVNIIISMVFDKGKGARFAEEYSNIIKYMHEYDEVTNKNYAVYRDFRNGEVIFSSAAKIYLSALMTTWRQSGKSERELKSLLSTSVDLIIKSYEEIGEQFDDINFILNMKNFEFVTLKEQINDFANSLISGG